MSGGARPFLRRSPRKRTLAALAGAALLAGCGRGEPPLARNLVLVTLDTTRADALGCYGARGNPTPALDALAAESTVYEAAQSAVPMTLPAHCSMMTGLYPPRHTVRDNAYWPLPASAETVAERASAAGLETAAFLAAVVLDPRFGLDQGFDVYDAPEPEQDAMHGERAAPEVVDRALAWLRERGGADEGRPFFLWVHLFDAHAPYEPPEGWRSDLSDYAAEVALVDREVGRLLAALRDRGRLDDSLVVVVGDHGEAFGEHGELAHGDLAYQPTVHVPLIVRRPDGVGAGQRSEAVVSVVDVHPTLLRALGLPLEEGLDGRSLLEAPEPGRGVYVETYAGYFAQGWSPLAGWIEADAKYLHSSAPELYELERDPGETKNVFREDDPRVRHARLAISAVLERPSLTAEQRATVAPDLAERIRGLGYAAMGGAYEKVPHPLAPSERPAPWQMTDESERTVEAVNLALAGRYPEAVQALRAILDENPLNFVALHHLAFALMRQGLAEEAIEPLKTLLREGPKKAEWYSQLAACYNRLGRNAEAVEAMERAVAIEPSNESYHASLARLLRLEGRDAEAAEHEPR